MDFKNNKPIYLQIVDFCFRKILVGEWAAKGRIPSVRELSVDLQVNPNTTMRAFEYLTNENIIFSERGKGYFVSENAKNQILVLQKKEFFNEILPDVFSQMKILGISIEEITNFYNNSKS